MKKNNFGYGWLVKLNFLLLALGLVIYSIYHLNHRGISLEILGGETNAATLDSRVSSGSTSAHQNLQASSRSARLVVEKPASAAAKASATENTEGAQ